MTKLHIYGQGSWHEEAFIVGDKNALEYLRDAIDSALAQGNGKATVFASDGEGYDIHVYKEESVPYWDKSLRPYTDEMAQDLNEDAISPWDLFKKYKDDYKKNSS